MYKTYDGKPENTFGYDAKWLDVNKAEEVIKDNFMAYLNLRLGRTPNESNFDLHGGDFIFGGRSEDD